MLGLTRRKDESIIIGDRVEIAVVDSKDGRALLNISAPEGTPVRLNGLMTPDRQPWMSRDDSVKIGHDIEVIVTRVGPAKVGLAVGAPPDLTILRKELVLA